MPKSKEADLPEDFELEAALSVKDWQGVYGIIADKCPDIADAIILDLQDLLEGYERPGLTVELSADE